jgi:serine phosphatase RsbU (regulator of sigma subunit)
MVYYGAEGDFGILLPDSEGELTFYSFYLNFFKNVEIDFSSVWKTLIAGNRIYFQSFEKLFYVDLPIKIDASGKFLNEIKHIKPEKTQFHLAFSVNDKLYIREWEHGLGVVVDDRVKLIPGGEQFALSRVYIMEPYDENRILIGTRSSGFYLYDTSKKENAITPFYIEEQELIDNSTLYNGLLLHDGTYAIGTVNDGLIFLNKNGKIVNHFNQSIGLPDRFIHTVFVNKKDPLAPLWFFNGEDGIYKAYIANPFREWNEYNGIPKVPINDMIRFNGILYAITSNGLFYLNENQDRATFELIENIIEPWDLLEFVIPGTNEKILLMGSAQGVFQIEDFQITNIIEAVNVYKIYQSKRKPENLLIGSIEGLSLYSYNNGKWENKGNNELKYTITSILETDENLYLGTSSVGAIYLKDFYDTEYSMIDSANGLPLEGKTFLLHQINNKTVVSCGYGLYSLTDTTAKPFDYFGKEFCDSTFGVSNVFKTKDTYWLSVYENDFGNASFKLIKIDTENGLIKDTVFTKMIPQKHVYSIYPDQNYTWIGNEKGLFKLDNSIKSINNKPYNSIITKVSIKDSVLFSGNNFKLNENIPEINLLQDVKNIPILEYRYNKIVFEWAAPFFENENETEYCYRLVGENENWSKWDKKNDTRFTNLYEGDYTFEVKARNMYNIESSVSSFSFTILSPWYRTIWAYIIFTVIGIFVIYIIIRLYTRKLKKENEKLEQIVKERTAEIRMQNEEITAQRDEIQAQKEQVEKAKDKIEQQQKSIMDSIHYASRIQEAVLPPDEYLREILGEHFVLFKPRDIVSGDFYWATQRGNKTVIVAADCTGHGVPGAFMSMLGISFLNEIVNKEEILQANIILNRLRENVKRSLRQTGKENEAKDGMDLALCIIDIEHMELQFAGAYNPLYLLRDGDMQRVKADRMPIGIYLREKESFTNNIIDIKKGDYLYIFSDGFVDQFGGPTDDKIKSANFKNILLENSKKSPDEQKEALAKFLDEWMSYKDKTGRKYKQVDDILVIGIEI